MLFGGKTLTPASIRQPFARYGHGVAVPDGARWIVTSGQLGITVADLVSEGAEAQAALCFANCAAILAEGGMGPQDVVRINGFVTDRAIWRGIWRRGTLGWRRFRGCLRPSW